MKSRKTQRRSRRTRRAKQRLSKRRFARQIGGEIKDFLDDECTKGKSRFQRLWNYRTLSKCKNNRYAILRKIQGNLNKLSIYEDECKRGNLDPNEPQENFNKYRKFRKCVTEKVEKEEKEKNASLLNYDFYGDANRVIREGEDKVLKDKDRLRAYNALKESIEQKNQVSPESLNLPSHVNDFNYDNVVNDDVNVDDITRISNNKMKDWITVFKGNDNAANELDNKFKYEFGKNFINCGVWDDIKNKLLSAYYHDAYNRIKDLNIYNETVKDEVYSKKLRELLLKYNKQNLENTGPLNCAIITEMILFLKERVLNLTTDDDHDDRIFYE